MVHGGGSHGGGGGGGGGGFGGGGHRHHHHYGGGSWFGRNRGYDRNTYVFNNNTGSGPGYSSYQQGGPYQSNYYAGQQDDCGPCCKKLCMCCFCYVASSTVAGAIGPSRITGGFFCALLFFFILTVVSYENDDWTLNGGESRRVSLPRLTKGLQFHSNVVNGIDIYALKDTCPPLTGPNVQLNDEFDVSLARGDYQYDYFYLNKASTLKVDVSQTTGASSVIVIQGKQNFDCWKDDDCDFNFSRHVAIKRYAGANQVAHIKYTAPESDFYVVIYDNASKSNGHCIVNYHADLTSYNLDGLSPIPQSWCDASGSCFVESKGKDFRCILVQAKTDQQNVTVKVNGQRQWGVILSITLTPIAVALFLTYLNNKEEEHSGQNPQSGTARRPSESDSADRMFVKPSAPVDDVRASLINPIDPPMAEATLEPSDQSFTKIPVVNIAAGDVIPVPPPTDKV